MLRWIICERWLAGVCSPVDAACNACKRGGCALTVPVCYETLQTDSTPLELFRAKGLLALANANYVAGPAVVSPKLLATYLKSDIQGGAEHSAYNAVSASPNPGV